ncbi:Exodeoxyribonuclease VII small subunit [Actinomyces ruminicola]|uniref:Exodeoxyribonuclease 7 small subunit n=1 Tax=Actinomyces ruminicola TaxID=332524 RepID=A0A1H0DFM1_9ACTO|nr:exodeoxyribonuclease VII small subunit [Actinomyces ruminicola]SDN68769.1 Exodeoxyribonuclease VII small subunit [Actinomyces ruminicola]
MSEPSPAESTGPADANADVASLPYEQAREQLVGVVQRLEAGQVPLEEALKLWERGEALAARCQSWLDDARARLAAVADVGHADTADDSGAPGNHASTPF